MTLDANMNTSDIEERFEQIAKVLFERIGEPSPDPFDPLEWQLDQYDDTGGRPV